jgi:3-methyladenine DNA glycosylase/8-oxoguanine DNA glycosylase
MTVEAEFDRPRNPSTILGPLGRGGGDPAFLRMPDGALWIVGLCEEGAFTARMVAASGSVRATFWGEAAEWARARLPDMLGAGDDPAGFVPGHRVVADQWRRHGMTWRVPRTHLTWQVALAAVLEQRVTGVEARRAWHGLVTEHGSPAPGPTPRPMHVPPDAGVVLRVPSWDWRRYGVDRQRLRAVRELARSGRVLQRAERLAPAQGRESLRVIPGVGAWTAAEISARAFGDADAVSVGDFHLARTIVYALTGRDGGTDEDMLGLLRPYEGHRHRVVRMVELSGVAPPRRGPRMRLPGPG